jgi:hypothetical protein
MGRALGHLIGWFIVAAYGPGWLLLRWLEDWISGKGEEKEKDHG